jgi:cell division protein ZapA (FtsZ GTPase activity inhibitor)
MTSDGATLGETAAVIQTLESVRVRLEDRFLSAGGMMAAALEGIEALIRSLDRLSGVLEGDASADANRALQGAAADLLTLPAVQAERRTAFEALVASSERLGANIEAMRTMLRYLRAFTLNLKVTAAAAAEFAGFGEELMERITIGAEKLASFSGKLEELDEQLRRALAFVCALESDCEHVLPSVASNLQVSAEAIQSYNREINLVAGQVAELARQIREKVSAALIAMQIGDNTRQRIEHVQAGLAMLSRPPPAAAGLVNDERALNTVRRMLLDQLADLSETFGVEAQRVTDNLLGLSADAREVLRLKTLIGDGQNGGFLRDLESRVGQANGVVDQVRSANSQAGEAGRAVVDAVEALLVNVDAIQSVKTEIRYMAINTSLRCSRMGEAGRPVNVIGLELRAGADKLGEAAAGAQADLDGLAEGAGRFVDRETDTDLGRELDQALANIRQAGDSAEADLVAVASGSATVAQIMAELSANADFHADLRQTLADARAALERQTGEALPRGAPAPQALTATLDQILALYTMGREREIHMAYAGSGATAPPVGARANDADEEDAALFANALF